MDTLRRGVDLLIAPPGQRPDLVGQRHANRSKIDFLVLDEPDHMLDMERLRDRLRILGLLPEVRQHLLFSDTFSDDIRELAGGLRTGNCPAHSARRSNGHPGLPPRG